MAAATKHRLPSVARHRAGHTLPVAPAASSDSFVLKIRSAACSQRMILLFPGVRGRLQHAPRAGQRDVWRGFTCGLMQPGLIGAGTASASINHLLACLILASLSGVTT
jgi:hypothetical protein